jgi:hypothetical protein
MAGWEPATTTTYRYDDQGRLVEAVTVSEPEWSDEDRAWAAALDLAESRLCSSCGGPRAECRGRDRAAGLEATHEICAKTWVAALHQQKVLDEDKAVQMPAQAVHVTTRRRSEG